MPKPSSGRKNAGKVSKIIAETHALGYKSVSEKTVAAATRSLISYTERALDGAKKRELKKIIRENEHTSEGLAIMAVMLKHSEKVNIPEKITSDFIAETLINYAKKVNDKNVA